MAATTNHGGIRAGAGRKTGRPSQYLPGFAALAKNYCLLGADDAKLGELFEVSERTINRWKAFPDFAAALRQGKDAADAEVAVALYRRATGYSHPDVHVSNFQGGITVTNIVKHYPPDTTAATWWLKNRQPKQWKELVEVVADIKGDPFPAKEVLDAIYKKALEQAAVRDECARERTDGIPAVSTMTTPARVCG